VRVCRRGTGGEQGPGAPLLPEVLTGRDCDLLTRLLDPGFVSHVAGGADAGAGAGAYAAAVDATYAAFPDLVVTVHDQVAEDDRVVTRWSATGTHAADFAGVPATGRLVTVSGMPDPR